MPRRPPSADTIGIGGTVIAVTTAGAAIAFTPNVVIGLVLMAIAASVTVVLVVWYVIGSRNQRIDRKKAADARLAAQRPLLEALASIGRPKPDGPVAIHVEGTGKAMIRGNTFGPGFAKDIHAVGTQDLTIEDNKHSVSPPPHPDTRPSQSKLRSPRRSKHGR